MQETQATAAALEHVPGPERGYETGISVIGGTWSPEEFTKRIEREKAMRQILKEYVKSELKKGYHYDDNIGGQKLAKPMLLQEGARAIAAIFGLFFGEPKTVEERLEGDHFRVRAHIALFNQAGVQITSGDALCSTREVKYAFRKAERECPECGSAAIIKGRAEYGGGYVCFAKKGGCGAKFDDTDERIGEQRGGRVENPDLADVENTVLKMAIKRAKVAAVCDLPTVSEIFAPEGSADTPVRVGDASSPKESVRPKRAHDDKSVVAPISPVDVVCGFIDKLVALKEPIADLKELYLPAGVEEFKDLTAEQAEDIREDVLAALNTRLKKSN
jgi:DNA-directed RNA polymerase subunit RPC12/RpoP